MIDIIKLNDSFLIGGGRHKHVYLHPHEKDKCIKIAHTLPDPDIDRELKYRKIHKAKTANSKMLPKYYGTITTNLGTGFVFELVRDYNHIISKTMYQFIDSEPFTEQHIKKVQSMLLTFKNIYFQEKILTYDMNPVNYLVQKTSPTEITIRCIDDIGSSVLIPLELYCNYFHDAKINRYWAKLINKLIIRYPAISTPEFINQLKL